jgi:hypothetical protein
MPSPDPVFSFTVDTHHDFFTSRVPGAVKPGEEGEQRRIRRLLAALREIHEAGCGGKNPAIRRLGRAMQLPFDTLRRHYYSYILGCHKSGQLLPAGDWRILLNWSRVKTVQNRLPFAFLEFWRGLGERNQRKWKPAWDELIAIIRSGYDFTGRHYPKIPGYTITPAIDPVLGHPRGMSYDNLMRHTSTPYEQRAARVGRAAAAAHRLPVLKTRVHLRLGQEYCFDDHVFDQKTLFQKKPMRPLCFGVVDVLSDCLFKLGVKPTLWDAADGGKRELTEREFLWFVLAVLCGTGYRRDKTGTLLNMERAKATIREPYLTRIRAILGDHVKFYFGAHPGAHTRAAHAGQYSGQPKGNPRTKAIVESKWNTLENQMASLMGQVGKDRAHSPASLHGAEKYTAQLMRRAGQAPSPVYGAGQAPPPVYGVGQAPSPVYEPAPGEQGTASNAHSLGVGTACPHIFGHTGGGAGTSHSHPAHSPEPTAHSLLLPFHSYHRWCHYARAAVERINHATDHHCEGWEKLNFIRKQWRPAPDSPHWLEEADFAALDDITRAAMKARLNDPAHAAILQRLTRASRWEVWTAHRHELTQLSMAHLPEILGREFALDGGAPIAVGRYQPGLISFQCEEIDTHTLHFYARDVKAAATHFIPDGEKFICFVNPYLPTHLVACDEKLRVVALCPRYEPAHDASSLAVNMSAQAAMESAARVRLNLRHDDESRRKRHMREHNDRVIEAASAIETTIAPPQVNPTADEILARETSETEIVDQW